VEVDRRACLLAGPGEYHLDRSHPNNDEAWVRAENEVLSEELSRQAASGATYLDVRTEQEYEQGHVPGAFNVPLKHGSVAGLSENENFAAIVQANFPADQTLILGCHSGNRARQAAEKLRDLGYAQILLHLDSWDGQRDAFGGKKTQGYAAANLPIERQPQAGRSFDELARVAGHGRQGSSSS